MFIGGHDLPCIGLIRPKELGDGRVMLTIYPPGPGALAGAGAATMVEIVVDEAEVERIGDVAPHLLAKRPHSRER
ncbi:hypothetical protein [Sphingomonas echinoides]|jgi:hypothetical protein|uniref:Uncharacterized protein n=1 Tax=Sphingomonas echinoides TaxID=59803 RepID=A0ABU4PHN4_9SPHN|nr:hypothetical protein [Sphingomonas echinoides]MDX5983705.1 hypothetical protein [Sphingomonas echinoides]